MSSHVEVVASLQMLWEIFPLQPATAPQGQMMLLTQVECHGQYSPCMHALQSGIFSETQAGDRDLPIVPANFSSLFILI
jgi:hypothetical protein